MKEVSTNLYLVRHGETEWNAAGRTQGHLDSPLTVQGRRQAGLVAEGLKERGIETILSSDLGRARETCRIIASSLGLGFSTDAAFRERNLGILQGRTRAEFARDEPEIFRSFASGDPDFVIPGGESRRQHYRTVSDAAVRFVNAHRGQTLLLVAHGGVLSVLMRFALGLDPGTERRFSLLNGAINHFMITGDRWQLVTWGECAHLREVGTRDDD